MWDIGNEDIIVLASVISVGCAIIFNFWSGSFIQLTLTLVLVIIIIIIIAWWCTNHYPHHHQHRTTDDTPLLISPHVLLALGYLKQAGRELNVFFHNFYNTIFVYSLVIRDRIYNLYDRHIIERIMAAQRRRNTYQLSAEKTNYNITNQRNSTRLNIVDRGEISPIPHRAGGSYNLENMTHYSRTDLRESTSLIHEGHQQVTSTPLISSSSSLFSLRKDNSRNGHTDFGSDPSGINTNSWKNYHSALLQNHTLSRGDDTIYSVMDRSNSPWGTSISPKMRSRAGGVKTVQTVAGPLLASTRYNIDPKVHSDVTSPGLTTRLTKYATEANMKLTHQSQYGTGQFPRVNLNSSPTPLIHTKAGKMRMPVTVRVAPPESTTRYSPPERQQILSDICRAESKTGQSVVQVLREISLKRHASREDVAFDFVKKQRTEGVFSDGLENLEEMTQKRGRDDSSRSEEDLSPPNNVFGRPAKRSKVPSCCYDILSSLSSSINVSSGIKRKAIDVSQSETPDAGKHFKSLDFSDDGGDGMPISPISHSISEPTKKFNKQSLDKSEESADSNRQSSQRRSQDSVSEKIIFKSLPKKEILNNGSGDNSGEKNGEISPHDGIREREKISKFSSMPVKFTDKLFMRAEPQNIDKLKTLIEEHGSIKPRFTTNDTDEIKKSDIVTMRQTSMKTRLKSMFDAISGKATSNINPEVVIQAEESKVSSSESTVVSLNSSTWTTNVNTSPIATSAIVPIIGKTKPTTTPSKHVTFQLNNVETSIPITSVVESSTIDVAPIGTKITDNQNATKEPEQKIDNPKNVKSTVNSTFQTSNFSSNKTIDGSTSSGASIPSSIPSAFSIAPSSTSTSTTNDFTSPASSSALAKSAISPICTASLVMKTITTSPSQYNSTKMLNSSTTSSSLFGISTPTLAKSISSPLSNLSSASQSGKSNFQTPSVNFSFGTPGNTSLATPKSHNNQSGSSLEMNQNSTTSSSLPITTGDSKSELFGFATASKPAYSYPSTLNAPVSTAFSFGGNTAMPQTTNRKDFTFGGPTVSSTKAQETTPIAISSVETVTSQPVVTTSTGGGFNFSTNNNNATSTTTSSLFGTPVTSTSSLGFATSTSTVPAFTFGSHLSTTAANTKPGFSFVASSTTPATVAATTPATTTVSTLSFGTPSTNVAIPLFGVSSTTSSSTTANNNTQPIFGASTTSTTGFMTSVANSPAFGTTSSQPASSFTSNSIAASTFGTPKTTESSGFGTNTDGQVGSFAANSTTSGGLFSRVNTDATTTNSMPTFGGSNFGQTKAPPAFGVNTASSFATAGSTNLFGTQPTTTSVTFGTPVNTGGTQNPSPAPIFGTSSSTPALSFGIPSTQISSFGAPSTTTVPTFGTPTTAPPPFGATNNTLTSSSTATTTNNFGAVSTVTSAFGGNNTATSAFGSQSNLTAGTNVNPNTAGSTFGAVTTAPPAFPTSLTPQFGMSGSNNQPPPFSSANTNFTGFGASSSNTASPFANQPTPSAPVFGSSNISNTSFGNNNPSNNGNSSFNFTQPTVQQPQRSSVFAFGGGASTSGNNATSGSAPFQFGSAPPQTGGFNFTGGNTTPAINFPKDGISGGSFGSLPAPGANAFNAPTTGGMFSIGTGSTAPRSRPSRRRQR